MLIKIIQVYKIDKYISWCESIYTDEYSEVYIDYNCIEKWRKEDEKYSTIYIKSNLTYPKGYTMRVLGFPSEEIINKYNEKEQQ